MSSLDARRALAPFADDGRDDPIPAPICPSCGASLANAPVHDVKGDMDGEWITLTFLVCLACGTDTCTDDL